MTKTKHWTRWHRFDEAGTKFIKRFEIDEVPPKSEEGFTEWTRGTGPLTEEHYNNVANAVRKVTAGIPKSEEQKEKMRLAKLGVPKSDAHRKAMADAWVKRRQNTYRDAMAKLEELRRNG